MAEEALLFLAIGVAGGLGAVARYRLAHAIQQRARSAFPLGTLVVNITGSFVLGLVSQLLLRGLLDAPWASILGIGFAGGYTTYSGFNYETLQLVEQRALLVAALNVILTGGMCSLGGLAGVALVG